MTLDHFSDVPAPPPSYATDLATPPIMRRARARDVRAHPCDGWLSLHHLVRRVCSGNPPPAPFLLHAPRPLNSSLSLVLP